MGPNFYKNIRESLFGGKLIQSQVDGIEVICKAFGEGELNHLAYILATVYHETDQTFRPIEEYGKGKTKDYGKKLDVGKGPGKRISYTTPDKLYYGRGYEQLTWRDNYLRMGKLIGEDLLNNPELMLTIPVASKSIIAGMKTGLYTTHKLSDFSNGKEFDFKNARTIINGLNKAELIAGYAHKFLIALKSQNYGLDRFY